MCQALPLNNPVTFAASLLAVWLAACMVPAVTYLKPLLCPGLADRLASSVSILLYAILTNRAFLYDWDPPPPPPGTPVGCKATNANHANRAYLSAFLPPPQAPCLSFELRAAAFIGRRSCTSLTHSPEPYYLQWQAPSCIAFQERRML